MPEIVQQLTLPYLGEFWWKLWALFYCLFYHMTFGLVLCDFRVLMTFGRSSDIIRSTFVPSILTYEPTVICIILPLQGSSSTEFNNHTFNMTSENHICTICKDCDQWHKSVGIYTCNHKIRCTPRALVQTRQFFQGNLRTNNSKISAQLKAPFHPLCLKVPTNSSLAQRINICLCIAKCVSNKGLN
jgi:hypothetical protein